MFYRVSLVILVIVFMVKWFYNTRKFAKELESRKDMALNDLTNFMNSTAAELGMSFFERNTDIMQLNKQYQAIVKALDSKKADKKSELSKRREAYNSVAYQLNDQLVTFPYSCVSKGSGVEPAEYVGTEDEIRVQITELNAKYSY